MSLNVDLLWVLFPAPQLYVISNLISRGIIDFFKDDNVLGDSNVTLKRTFVSKCYVNYKKLLVITVISEMYRHIQFMLF